MSVRVSVTPTMDESIRLSAPTFPGSTTLKTIIARRRGYPWANCSLCMALLAERRQEMTPRSGNGQHGGGRKCEMPAKGAVMSAGEI